MKRLSACLAGILSAALLISTACAYGEFATVSDWAAEEVTRAESLDLAWSQDYLDYTAPITRDEFFKLAINYVSVQNHFNDSWPFVLMMEHYKMERDENGNLINPFTDTSIGDTYSKTVYTLGIATGDENGAYNADRTITRQEAAAILVRAYQVCGGELPEEMEDITFTDVDEIQDWAKENASALAVWGVMKGDDSGNFRPNDLCSTEQAILMFLRLYESAPVSRVNGNAEPLFTYEQSMEWIQLAYGDSTSTMPLYNLTTIGETDGVTVLRSNTFGMMQSHTTLYFVHRDGGIIRVEGQNYGLKPSKEIENLSLSEDGSTLTFNVTHENQFIYFSIQIDPGIYQVTIDTQTGKSEMELLQSLPEE